MNPRRTQLFLDDEIIEQTVRLQRIIHQPQKHPANPLYTVGAPWKARESSISPASTLTHRTTSGKPGTSHCIRPPTRRSSTPSA